MQLENRFSMSASEPVHIFRIRIESHRISFKSTSDKKQEKKTNSKTDKQPMHSTGYDEPMKKKNAWKIFSLVRLSLFSIAVSRLYNTDQHFAESSYKGKNLLNLNEIFID